MKHYSVLLDESILHLVTNRDGVYVDVTLGGGGHSSLILNKLSEKGKLIAIDQDKFAIDLNQAKFKDEPRITIKRGNFADIKTILKDLGIEKVDGIIADIGVSSFQFNDPTRGFSYRFDNVLDMRMDDSLIIDAKYIVNNYSLEELTRVFKEYGEETYSYKIAKNIITYRSEKEIETTFQLNDIIKGSLPNKVLKKKGHPSKKIYQALRVEVNRELDVLKKLLADSFDVLKIGGRFIIISFQSLEDRIIKHFIKDKEIDCICPNDFPICTCNEKRLVKSLFRKPLLASKEELSENNRSHSAKMRGYEKVAEYES